MSKAALFLDRDGVINVDHGYVGTRDRFEFVEGIFEVCRRATSLGFVIFVITNQAGIARGYYSEDDFRNLSEWMRSEFLAQGAVIAKVYHCPFHPDATIDRYRQHSPLRKPAPGMILQAKGEHDVDLARSVLLGDKESDIEAGIAAGVGCNILIDNGCVNRSSKASVVVHTLPEVLPYLTDARNDAGNMADVA